MPLDDVNVKLREMSMREPSSPGRVRFLRDLKAVLVSKNQLQNLDTHPLGLEVSVFLNSAGAQTILNVKHLSSNSKRQLKKTILHAKTGGRTWFRIRLAPDATVAPVVAALAKMDLPCDFLNLTPRICEFYYDGNTSQTHDTQMYANMKVAFEHCDEVEEIIFYSNCKLIATIEMCFNTIFSSIFKFYYCMFRNSPDTLVTLEDVEMTFFMQLHCYLLATQRNFCSNNSGLLQPLSILSGEKNQSTLKACKDKIYATGAPRDGLFINEGCYMGGNNKVELMFDLETDPSLIIENSQY
ncbi:MAG: hypothetical protein MUO31_07130 [Thermodesulfovibrionales bacterium]|nr:hypothetical protein [Thermodesulfovibrionales bacterium]